MLAAPEKLELLNAPMALETAKEMVALVPADFMETLLEQSLGMEAVGLALLAAHLIIFWLSQDSNVTPPVCLTAFAAATIAKTPPMRTGLMAWKIAKGLYLVPLLIAYTGLVSWDVTSVITVGFFAIIGTYALIGAIEGYLEGPLNILTRLLLVSGGYIAGLARHPNVGSCGKLRGICRGVHLQWSQVQIATISTIGFIRGRMKSVYDYIIVGGGIVGVSTAWQLQQRHPDKSILLVEKESGFAKHQNRTQ